MTLSTKQQCNSGPADVLAEHDLSSPVSRTRALKAASEQQDSKADRFEYINFKNSSSFQVSIVMFDGQQRYGEPPSGYVEKTGAIVGGVNISPGSQVRGDVPPAIKCQADIVNCSLLYIDNSGEQQEFHFDPEEPDNPLTEFLQYATFEVVNGAKNTLSIRRLVHPTPIRTKRPIFGTSTAVPNGDYDCRASVTFNDGKVTVRLGSSFGLPNGTTVPLASNTGVMRITDDKNGHAII